MLRKLFVFAVCLMAAITTASAQTPPYNEIWYTTTDGRTISFNDDNLFSNSYNNGRGVLKFRDSVISIGYRVFWNCSSLTSITIPESVTEIKDGAFSGCSSLPVIDNIRYADTYLIEAVDKSLTSYSIKEGTRFIGSWAFARCSNLKSITTPNSVTSIGESAFRGCSSLTSITIPNSVTSIEKWTFDGCSSLTSITIPNSVTRIDDCAFGDCSSLTSITIPNSVTSIGWYAFSGCSGLTSITIPNSVTSIGWYAFYGCSSLTNITIPNSVTFIGYAAFRHCSSLTSITCLATTPPAIDDLRIAETTMIYVPKEAVKAYKQDPKWGIYKKQIKPIK